MKKRILTVLLAAFSATVFAQYSQETALDLQPGANSCELESPDGSAYWKYTPAEKTLLTVDTQSGSGYVSAYTVGDDGGEATLQGVRKSDYETVYYLEEGETSYFRAYGAATVAFDAKMVTGGNVGKGLSADDPVVLTSGEDAYLGLPGYSSSGQTAYATYTAEDDGLLVVSATDYAYVSVNGAVGTGFDYSNGGYVFSLSVEKGKTYDFKFSQFYSAFIISPELTHPQPGSQEMPFELVEGDNTVPSAYGEYYYKYTCTKTGYGVISSESALARGDVKVYDSKSGMQYGQVYAQSASGRYDVRFEMPYEGVTYYICVNKVTGTSEDETFAFKVENYAKGDKENNPIEIGELPATVTTRAAGGSSYYTVVVPAGVRKFLNVEATSEITSPNTNVSVYVVGSSWDAKSGNKQVRIELDGTQSDLPYMIKWTSSETEPITFTVSLDDIKPGDVITDPLTAQLGENTIEGSGTKYYMYTATLTGKLVVEGTPEMAVSFPAGTDPYSGTYPYTVVGSSYTLGVSEGQTYYIKIENASDGDVFKLSEAEYEVGESRDNPLEVEDGKFTLGSDVYADYWLKYTVEKDGVLTIESDIPYNYQDNVLFGKDTDPYMSGMITTVQEGEDYATIYKVETIASAGDVYLVNLKLASSYEGKTVTFTIRNAEVGETVDKPILLVPGQEVEIPTPSRTKPVWCKAALAEGEAKVEATDYVMAFLSQGYDNAKAGVGDYIYFDNYDSDYNPLDFYTWTGYIDVADDYYFKFEAGASGVKLKLGGTATSIDRLGVEGSQVSVSGGKLTVDADKAAVKVYTVSGALVADETVQGRKSFDLEPGIYIVKINDTVKKVAVR